jgi:hypothetical protein
MKFEEKYFHCGDHLLDTFRTQIEEIRTSIGKVKWKPEFSIKGPGGKTLEHQTAYNEAFRKQFLSLAWEYQPLLVESPKLIGDFRKHLVFVEVQFGNSATLYRDYYKFQYGHANGLLSLAVLIVPTSPKDFFPTRPGSVGNMAEYKLAERYLSVLPIQVPTLLVGFSQRTRSCEGRSRSGSA